MAGGVLDHRTALHLMRTGAAGVFGAVAGAITIIFFSVAMPMEKAISQFVAPVTETARAISRELSVL